MRSSTCASRVVRRDSRASRLACSWCWLKAAARLLEHALHQAQQFFFLEGLFDEVHRALLHRRHRHRHVAVAGDEDDGQRALALEQAVLQFQAAHAVHADVGDQAGHFTRVEAGEEGLRRVEALDAIVLAFEQPLQGISHRFVVIDNIDSAFLGDQAHSGTAVEWVGVSASGGEAAGSVRMGRFHRQVNAKRQPTTCAPL
jgi:hypothetical protein